MSADTADALPADKFGVGNQTFAIFFLVFYLNKGNRATRALRAIGNTQGWARGLHQFSGFKGNGLDIIF